MPDGPGRFTRDSTCPALLRIPLRGGALRVPGFHRLRRGFPAASARAPSSDNAVLQPRPRRNADGLGIVPGRSPLLGESFLFSFPAGTKMFQFPDGGTASRQDAGFSHSETRGSKVTCTSPRLVAACHVLHRLREPRHPPYALILFLLARTPTERGRAILLRLYTPALDRAG